MEIVLRRARADEKLTIYQPVNGDRLNAHRSRFMAYSIHEQMQCVSWRGGCAKKRARMEDAKFSIWAR